MSAILDPIQFSFERQEQLEHLCKFFLDQRDIVLPLKKRLRLQYLAALCDIGEPPIPRPSETRQEEEIRCLQEVCLRADGESDWMLR